ncbi:MAG: hypothetical protein KAH38_08930, partial [Candidatus Hydrogenedentes bacterium]|nr:hypothetical protein [Candidatus Hydrogenedentota bacterium]
MQKIIPRKILTSILLLIITPVFFIYGETNLQKSDSEIPKESVEVQQSEAIPNDPIEALQREVKALHDEIRMLQSTLDLMINQIMSDLREENILLRKEVQRLYAMQEDYGLPDISGIPRPGSELIDDILAEALPINTKELLEEEIFTDEPFEF